MSAGYDSNILDRGWVKNKKGPHVVLKFIECSENCLSAGSFLLYGLWQKNMSGGFVKCTIYGPWVTNYMEVLFNLLDGSWQTNCPDLVSNATSLL